MKYLMIAFCLLSLGCETLPPTAQEMAYRNEAASFLKCKEKDLDTIYFSNGAISYACAGFMFSPRRGDL